MRVTHLLAALSVALLPGCFPPADGLAPPPDQIYFPTGLAIDADRKFLLVVNSDFDLQYVEGTLQSFDLTRLREFIPRPCNRDADCSAEQRCDTSPTPENAGTPSYFCTATSGPKPGYPCGLLDENPPEIRTLYPGRCAGLDPVAPPDQSASLIIDSVAIGASARDIVYRSRPFDVEQRGLGRAFIPVAGDGTLHWVELLHDGRLHCGQGSLRGSCDDLHRSGDEPERENARGLRLAFDPFTAAATEDGRAIAVVSQNVNGGTLSLFLDDWSDQGPRLEYQLGGLPRYPAGVVAVPTPALVNARRLNYQPGFLVSYRDSLSVQLFRYFSDQGSDPPRPFLAVAGSVSLNTNPSAAGFESRGMALDASERLAAERECRVKFGISEACQADPQCVSGADEAHNREYKACVAEAATLPLRVFLANRDPESLLIGRTRSAINATSSDDHPNFFDAVPLSRGPSRVFTGMIINAAGEPELRAFVVCFDSRRIFIYDPARGRLETEISTGRGPHALAIDSEHGLAYVGHFTDSYIGVISLDQRFPRSYATLIAAIGKPIPPRTSK